MELGNFSISLTVRDIHISKSFYENLGFEQIDSDISQNWIIMKNGNSNIGLFQGMFDKNIITFNPGWDENATKINSFTDIRKLQKQLIEKGVKLEPELDAESSGPASFTIIDPDGNPILIDQHV
jgi:lactoylglutathione lyase